MTENFNIGGMTCTACAAAIERTVAKLEGVDSAVVNYATERLGVDYDDTVISDEAIVAAIEKIGYTAAVPQKTVAGKPAQAKAVALPGEEETSYQGLQRRLIISLIFTVPLFYLSMGPMIGLPIPWFLTGEKHVLINTLTQMLLTLPVVYMGSRFYKDGFKALYHRIPNMDSLVAVGTSAAFFYGIFVLFNLAWAYAYGNLEMVHHYGHEVYFEGTAVILTLITLGKFMEARAKGKTSQAIEKLLTLAPDTARVERSGVVTELPTGEVQIGDTIVIRPGDRIPVDGDISEGYSSVDESLLTGESIPVEKEVGSHVICGSINKTGAFKFKATKIGDDTTLAKIIQLVEEAQSTKAPIAKIADTISRYFVPAVMAIALLSFGVWLLLGQGFSFALSMGISVLVISCPCALGLATPTAIMVGTGKGAEQGILFKNGPALETLGKADTIVFDKTGTLTVGRPVLTDLLTYNSAVEDDLLATVAAIENKSEHPLSEAIVTGAAERGLSLPEVDEFNNIPGLGVEGSVGGLPYLIGNSKLMRSAKIDLMPYEETYTQLAAAGKTPIFIGSQDKVLAIIAVADTVKENTPEAIAHLKSLGLDVVMLTGDNEGTARAIGKTLGIEHVVAGVLPGEKSEHIAALQALGKQVIMVGDGINDAPALAQSDVGVAIGDGTDVAIESADVVLMKNDLLKVDAAIQLSRATLRKIKQNLFWAFIYNVIGIPLAAGLLYLPFGLRLNPMFAAAAMSLSSVSVVTNALSLKAFKPKYEGITREAATPEITAVKTEAPPRAFEKNNNESEGETMEKKLHVDDMSCMHCVKRVKEALEGVPGVRDVNVDLDAAEAQVFLKDEVADDKLVQAVTDAGYPAKMING